MILRGFGSYPPGGGEFGDLYLKINIKEHEIFKRKGLDIYVTVPVTFSQAILGAEENTYTLWKYSCKRLKKVHNHLIRKLKNKKVLNLKIKLVI